MEQFDWTNRVESDMESIYWIIRRDMDAILPRRADNDIRAMLEKLIKDVQAQSKEDDRRE